MEVVGQVEVFGSAYYRQPDILLFNDRLKSTYVVTPKG